MLEEVKVTLRKKKRIIALKQSLQWTEAQPESTHKVNLNLPTGPQICTKCGSLVQKGQTLLLQELSA